MNLHTSPSAERQGLQSGKFFGRPRRNERKPLAVLLAVMAALAILLPACTDDNGNSDGGSETETSADDSANNDDSADAQPIVLNGQGNNLDAYSAEGTGEAPTFGNQRVVTNAEEDPDGLDINAQLCVFESDGQRMLIAGEDTGQPDPPAGWGIFELNGDKLGELSVEQVAKLTPTYQPAVADNPENYGCGLLPDGRILTTDVGQQAEGASGQLIIWFPPFDGFAEGEIEYCKLDVALPTAQSILVTGEDTALVAASRGGIFQFSNFPTSPTADGGCDSTDATDRPLSTTVTKTEIVATGPDGMASPAGLSPAPDDGFYASSVFTGVINEYDSDGTFRRTILTPPEGESLGEQTYSTGTPLGLTTDSGGNLWYADIGLVISDGGVGPGENTGSVRRISF
jgi:hypothetical protein